VAGLREFRLSLYGPGHCTGWRAVNALAQAFGEDALVPLAVGKRLTI
jgi:7,8-dihydropterin-6-yl-methyl-4-(beta-D-ribofuranosyl)aminobenzene 5'-phosphate synthase